MFAYLSLLVEKHVFDQIDVNFLIVGHTHCSIDQYFSVLGNAIAEANFIATPLGLEKLFLQTHKDSELRPTVVREICVYYDWVNFLKPHVNMKIKVHKIIKTNLVN